MRPDAIILAGGRSSRLGGTPKSGLRVHGRTLLDHTLRAVAHAGRVVVVGPPELTGNVGRATLVREDPPFSGPAAAVAAGLAALAQDQDDDGVWAPGRDWVLVLACDMPNIARAVPRLLAEAAESGQERTEAILSADASGRMQPLAAIYPRTVLKEAVAAVDKGGTNGTERGGLINAPMKALLARLQWRTVAVDPLATADVDTWDDAQALGISPTPADHSKATEVER